MSDQSFLSNVTLQRTWQQIKKTLTLVLINKNVSFGEKQQINVLKERKFVVWSALWISFPLRRQMCNLSASLWIAPLQSEIITSGVAYLRDSLTCRRHFDTLYFDTAAEVTHSSRGARKQLKWIRRHRNDVFNLWLQLVIKDHPATAAWQLSFDRFRITMQTFDNIFQSYEICP